MSARCRRLVVKWRGSGDLGEESDAPKGQKDSAWGFNPRLRVTKRRALKAAPEIHSVWENLYPPQIELAVRNPCAAFRARPSGLANPGLRPRAESFCPFGAINVSC